MYLFSILKKTENSKIGLSFWDFAAQAECLKKVGETRSASTVGKLQPATLHLELYLLQLALAHAGNRLWTRGACNGALNA